MFSIKEIFLFVIFKGNSRKNVLSIAIYCKSNAPNQFGGIFHTRNFCYGRVVSRFVHVFKD